jgi:Ca2+-binding RTX toxin-like protein
VVSGGGGGGGGDDQIFGGTGNDLLDGNRGNDEMSGGVGSDVIVGGEGDDALEGGSGSDTFIFEPTGGYDTVSDLNVSENDVIDLQSFILMGDFTKFKNDSIVQVGENTVISLSADTSIELLNIRAEALTQDSFLF